MARRIPFNSAPTTTSTLIIAARRTRTGLTMKNHGEVTVYIGPDSTVTTSTGFPFEEDDILEDIDYTDAWYGITASGTGDIRGIEVD